MYTAKTKGGENKNFVILIIIVITAKKKKLLVKNVIKEKYIRDKDVENDFINKL